MHLPRMEEKRAKQASGLEIIKSKLENSWSFCCVESDKLAEARERLERNKSRTHTVQRRRGVREERREMRERGLLCCGQSERKSSTSRDGPCGNEGTCLPVLMVLVLVMGLCWLLRLACPATAALCWVVPMMASADRWLLFSCVSMCSDS